MRKLYTLLLITTFTKALLSSCKKDAAGGKLSGTATSYFPTAKANSWTYVYSGLGNDTITNTLTGATTIINGKTYYVGTSPSKALKTTVPVYFYNDNHLLTVRSTESYSGLPITVELTYLNDTLSVGHVWNTTITDSGLMNDYPTTLSVKMIEKDTTKTLFSKTFNNVIHTQLTENSNYGPGIGSKLLATYDIYMAQNIGILEIDTNISGLTSTQILYNYSLK